MACARSSRKPAPNSRARGGGYWFAPHWWFIDGLGREETGRTRKEKERAGVLRQVGPSLSKVFGPRVRQHWYRILRASRIDVMFIEDGINVKSVERVLRMLLEVHDMHWGPGSRSTTTPSAAFRRFASSSTNSARTAPKPPRSPATSNPSTTN